MTYTNPIVTTPAVNLTMGSPSAVRSEVKGALTEGRGLPRKLQPPAAIKSAVSNQNQVHARLASPTADNANVNATMSTHATRFVASAKAMNER